MLIDWLILFQRTLQTLRSAFFLPSAHVLWTFMEVRENLLGFLTRLRSWTAERWGLWRNLLRWAKICYFSRNLGKKTSLQHLGFQDNIVIHCLLCIKNSSKHCTAFHISLSVFCFTICGSCQMFYSQRVCCRVKGWRIEGGFWSSFPLNWRTKLTRRWKRFWTMTFWWLR